MVFRVFLGGGREEETGGKSLGGLGGGKEKTGGRCWKKGFGEKNEKIGKNLGFWGEKMVSRGVLGGGREEEMGGTI